MHLITKQSINHFFMNVSVYIHNKTNMCQLAAILMLHSQALSANSNQSVATAHALSSSPHAAKMNV
jgi:hypothetical protein